MICQSCGQENPATNRFCGGCGTELQGSGFRVRGSGPRTPNPEPRSYTPKHLADRILESKAALEGERKQVTVLFADVKGSMELAEQLDPEEWSRITNQFFQILAAGIERFEGFVDKFTGDGIMALFGAPIAHEDHAQRACYAALHLRDELRRFAQQLRRDQGLDFATRIGLNSGEVVVGTIGDDLRMAYTAQGHTVGLAQRMEGLAEAGKIYVTAATAQLVEGFFALEDLGAFKVKGSSAPLQVYAIEGVGRLRTRFDRSRARGLSRFVGRDDEMRVLEAALARSARGEGQVIAIVAPAGTGKSRLCFEMVERCRAKGLTVLEAQALAHGRSIPLRPMLEMFRQRFGIREGDTDLATREKIAGTLLLLDPAAVEILPAMFEFMGVPDPARPAPRIDPEAAQRRILDHFRRLVLADTRDRTVVTLIEDLHWLDDASNRFVAGLVETTPQTRGLVLLNFRPEYDAEWMKPLDVQQIALQPLSSAAVQQMLAGVIGPDPSVRNLPAQIHARTGGNPFFAEEILQALIEDGSLAGSAGAYCLTRPLAKIPLPETVQTVLAGRIDRLEAREKHVLQTAAVIGRELTRVLLDSVCDGDELDDALAALRRGEFLVETALYPSIEYAFKHPLTQEVAYQSQLAAHRAGMHRAVAQAMETLYPEQLDERAAEIAWHWEAAGERVLAARWHARAAAWAEQRDVPAAMRHSHAASSLLPEMPEDREDARLLMHLCHRQLLVGGWALGQSHEESNALLARGMRAAEHHGDVEAQVRLRWGYSNTVISRGRFTEFLQNASENACMAEASDDEDFRAVSNMEVAFAHGFIGNLDACERGIEAFLRAAESRGQRPSSTIFFPHALAYSWRGEMRQWKGHMKEAAADMMRGHEIAASADTTTQVLVATQVLIFGEACGELEGALELAARTMKLAEEFGASNLRACARGTLARAHALRGEWHDAVRLFEESIALSNEHHTMLEGEGTQLASLAHAYIEIGKPQRAKETAERAIALVRERGSKLQELTNVVALARAEAVLGHADAVDPLLARAETLISDTGAIAVRPHLAVVQAERARQRGDTAAWRAHLEEAHRLFTEMGATGHAQRIAKTLRS